MQGSLYLTQIIQFVSGAFVTNKPGCFELQGRNTYERVLNYTPDISEYVSFSCFQWSWFFDESLRSNQLCRWLGTAHGDGQELFSYTLTDT